MAKTKTYYYKMLDGENFVIAIGKIMTSKEPKSTPTRPIIELTEYNTIKSVIDNKPQPSDDTKEIRIKDNLDGTYSYVEVDKPIYEDEGEE